MKIGIVIPNYYEQYLLKIANLNGKTKSSICGLIVENFLSYNLNLKKFPLFQQNVKIVFANEKPKNSVDDNSGSPSSDDVCTEEQSNCDIVDVVSTLEEMNDQIDVDVDPDGLPF